MNDVKTVLVSYKESLLHTFTFDQSKWILKEQFRSRLRVSFESTIASTIAVKVR